MNHASMQRQGLVQWHKLWLLLLCANPLWADVCSGLPGGPRDGWTYFPDNRVDGQAPGVFRLQPKQGGPAFRIAVTTLAISFDNTSANPVHAGDIEVARCQDGKQLQQFPLMAWQPINFGLSFFADDINFDGYLDFSVLTEFAGGWRARAYWVYDPASQSFVKNELTHALEVNLKGSVVDFDSKNRRISAGILAAVNACAGGEPDVYNVKNNRLILVHTVKIKSYANGRCTKTVWNMAGSTLRVTSETRVDSKGNPVGPNDIPPPVVPPVVKLLPVTQPPPASGALLVEHLPDGSQEGLFSNGPGRGQVGADSFVIPNGATITGLRWYGYRNCSGDPGESQAFEIAFFRDQNGLPSGEPLGTAQVQAKINPTTSTVGNSFGNHFQVFLYSVDLTSRLAIPAGQRTWLMIRQGFAHCSFLWNRSSSGDSDTAAWGLADGTDQIRYSGWHRLSPRAHFSFSLYGAK